MSQAVREDWAALKENASSGELISSWSLAVSLHLKAVNMVMFGPASRVTWADEEYIRGMMGMYHDTSATKVPGNG
jgi:hypothetical protein